MRKGFEVLEILADGRCHSGGAIARSLHISRAAVWERISVLRAAGLDIDAQAGRGYQLARPLELLSATAIRAALDTEARSRIGEIQVLAKTDSTNQRLLDLALTKDIHGHVCLAETQTRGRGRRGDLWHAPLAGGLYLSLGWRFERPPATFGALGLVVGVSAVEALTDCGCPGLGLKWPNDLVRGRDKLGGILIEMRSELSGPTTVVIGIGINVVLAEAVRQRIDQPSTDLLRACGSAPSRNLLAATLLSRLASALPQFCTHGFGPWRRRYEQLDVLRGEQVELVLPDGVVRGSVEGISGVGALQLRMNEGVRAYLSGRINRVPRES
ncbi:MAG: biotin--[acetyl-CoA-carboxylase] ligase [Gammaproteobacteria bacterium]|nr:biotin--[acetyl-CoA-carboxylase] ligase [Gammaproteobacteria bacterium]